jgi:hypothetical protein
MPITAVVLPAPLRPTRPTISPLSDGERGTVERDQLAEPLAQAVYRERRTLV